MKQSYQVNGKKHAAEWNKLQLRHYFVMSLHCIGPLLQEFEVIRTLLLPEFVSGKVGNVRVF